MTGMHTRCTLFGCRVGPNTGHTEVFSCFWCVNVKRESNTLFVLPVFIIRGSCTTSYMPSKGGVEVRPGEDVGTAVLFGVSFPE